MENLIKEQVKEVYSSAAEAATPNLCCPTSYNPELLEGLPQEIIDKDYGCGDPSLYVKEGDHVLDLGSGVGKMCYMTAKVVGPSGKVTGVDINTDMLEIATKYKDEMNARENVGKVNFVRAEIQDMKIDLDKVDGYIQKSDISQFSDIKNFNAYLETLRNAPAIPSDSYDVVISNCVLNLVEEEDRRSLVKEIYRVLKPGGRFVISDIVSSKTVPHELKIKDNLWAECLTGSFEEEDFGRVFVKDGFAHVKYENWNNDVWREIEGIDFRSVTLTGFKPVNTVCNNCEYQVIYKGPFNEIIDDLDHKYPKGKRVFVCEETFDHLRSFAGKDFVFINPENKIESTNQEEAACCVSC